MSRAQLSSGPGRVVLLDPDERPADAQICICAHRALVLEPRVPARPVVPVATSPAIVLAERAGVSARSGAAAASDRRARHARSVSSTAARACRRKTGRFAAKREHGAGQTSGRVPQPGSASASSIAWPRLDVACADLEDRRGAPRAARGRRGSSTIVAASCGKRLASHEVSGLVHRVPRPQEPRSACVVGRASATRHAPARRRPRRNAPLARARSAGARRASYARDSSGPSAAAARCQALRSGFVVRVRERAVNEPPLGRVGAVVGGRTHERDDGTRPHLRRCAAAPSASTSRNASSGRPSEPSARQHDAGSCPNCRRQRRPPLDDLRRRAARAARRTRARARSPSRSGRRAPPCPRS